MAAQADSPRIQPWSLWLIAALLLGGVLVSINYVKRNRAESLDPRPPFLGKLERDFEALNRDGSTVRLSQLKGRIWLAAHLYTDSPEKSPAVARHLKAIWGEFEADPRLQIVIFSVNPAGDSPEKRNQFLRAHGVDDPRWWFLTAEPREITRYLVRYVRMMPPSPLTNPERRRDWGPYQHDVRVALIDEKANLRRHYQLLHPETGNLHLARLREDLAYLLADGRGRP